MVQLKIDPAHKYPHTKYRWTIADIAEQNESAGQYFFSRGTMRYWGDTRKSFAVVHQAGKVLIRRVKGNKAMAGALVGQIREFDPTTGKISSPLDTDISRLQ